VASQLSIYQGALNTYLGQRTIASLTVNEQSRYLLDTVWNDNFVQNCLECGEWEFAIRSVQQTFDANITPSFGLTYAFDKPSDWRRTVAMCVDPRFELPLDSYVDEAGYWYADLQTLYIRYVSDDPAYGLDMSKWPESFVDWMKCRLANRIAKALTNATVDIDALRKMEEKLMIEARTRCAMTGPTQKPAPGTWLLSRRGYWGRGRC
jgi:hypothetical protein